MAIASGTRLGPYEVLDRIGGGGMGNVYRARDTRLDRVVAIKVLADKHSSDPELKERFKREARNISRLADPHICILLDIGSEAECDFLVMEYLEGETLAQRLRRGAMPLDEALGIAIDVGDSLDKAHRLGMVHRDLKPGNIMLTTSGTKLLDFGLAKDVRSNLRADSATTEFATLPGVMLGTMPYMSPEQVRGLEVDACSDIWSLGVVLYEMLTGRMPFSGPTQSDIIASILLHDPPPPAELRHDFPEKLGRILNKALAKNPSARHQTAADLVRDLDRVRNQLRWTHSVASAAAEPLTATHGVDGAIESTSPRIPVSLLQILGGTGSLLVVLAIVALIARGAIGVPVGLVIIIAGVVAGGTWLLLTRRDSVAVLPFAYIGMDSQPSDAQYEYLADGITESIINNVSQVPRLKVISRSSVFRYKSRTPNPHLVGRELQVRNVLTGRILHQHQVLEISVALERTSDSKHLWGKKYEYEMADLAAVPQQIADDILRNLRARWVRGAGIGAAHQVNSEAYEDFLRGRYFWNKRTGENIRKALECFQKALLHDPKYALAHVCIAECYIALGVYSDMQLGEAYAHAKAAVMQAMLLDPDLPEAHVPLAVIKAGDEWDLKGALQQFALAVRLRSNYATAHQWYAEHLVCAGLESQAIREARRALELDPLSLVVNASYGMVLMQARHFDEAIAQLHKTVEMDGNFYLAHRVLRDAYLEVNMYAASIEHHRLGARLSGESPEEAEVRAAELLSVYGQGGPPAYWRKRMEQSDADRKATRSLAYDYADVSPYKVANLHARLGETEAAVRWLQVAFERRDYGLYLLRTNPAFDKLQSHPEVAAITRRLRLCS